MRNALVQLILVIIGISSIHAARFFATSSFHLRVGPAAAAKKVRAIQGHDTLVMTGMNGAYSIRSINPGNWQILVTATAPYRDCQYDLLVQPGGNIDLGEIRLLQ